MDVITPLVTHLGVLGALVWYMYYTTAVTLPNLTVKHTEEYNKLSSEHQEAIERITSNFTSTLKDEREIRRAELEALRVWINNEAACRYNKDHP